MGEDLSLTLNCSYLEKFITKFKGFISVEVNSSLIFQRANDRMYCSEAISYSYAGDSSIEPLNLFASFGQGGSRGFVLLWVSRLHASRLPLITMD